MKMLEVALSWLSMVLGVILLALSPFLPADSFIFHLSLGLGIALMPGGLIAIIIARATASVIEGSLREKISQLSVDLDKSVDKLNSATAFLDSSHRLGVRAVHPDRKQALHSFLSYLEGYVQNSAIPKREIIFVGSSLKGVITETPAFAAQLDRILKTAQQYPKEECACFFLLTHPFYSRYRESQEDRPPTAIAKEILHAIAWIEDRSGRSVNTRTKVYKGTPTCFMISTTERMLINPYPYQVEAFKCFCLEVEASDHPDAIHRAFHINHFYKPWFGEENQEDHYLQPNALDYLHLNLEGPVPSLNRRVTGTPEKYGDFFVIPDQGSFYLAVNVRGLAAEVAFDRKADGSQDVMRISPRLDVKLLNLAPTAASHWETVGHIDLDDQRNGFWHDRLTERSLSAYSMLGVFDAANPSPFMHEPEASEAIRGTSLPILWRWLFPVDISTRKTLEPSIVPEPA